MYIAVPARQRSPPATRSLRPERLLPVEQESGTPRAPGSARNPHVLACTLRFLRAGGHRQPTAHDALQGIFPPSSSVLLDILRYFHVRCGVCAPAATLRPLLATPRNGFPAIWFHDARNLHVLACTLRFLRASGLRQPPARYVLKGFYPGPRRA